MMFAQVLLSTQRLSLLIDDFGREKCMQNIVRKLLMESEDNDIMELPFNKSLKHTKTFERFLSDCQIKSNNDNGNWNVLLPPLSDLLCYQPACMLFDFLHKLRHNASVKRIYLCIMPQHVVHDHVDYIVDALQYMADMVLHFQTPTEVLLFVRKSGGGITNSRYNYEHQNQSINLTAQKIKSNATDTTLPVKLECVTESPKSTFRIELDEDEMMTRNALALPYEKTASDAGEIIYTPDAYDGFDNEDPDEDLDI